MPNMSEALSLIIGNGAFIEDQYTALRESFLELHAQATRQFEEIERLEKEIEDMKEEISELRQRKDNLAF